MDQHLQFLVVEDAEDDALLLLRALKQQGFAFEHRRVDTLAGLSAALGDQEWDLVLADFNLPGFTALDALAVVRERVCDLPFIMVSGAVGEEMAVAAMRAGANDFIVKGNYTRLGPAIERELKEAENRRRRRQAEAALQRSEAVLAEAERIAHLGSWEWHPASGHAYWSAEAWRILGLEPFSAEPNFELFLQAVHPEDREKVNQCLGGLQGGDTRFELEHRLRRPDGGERIVRQRAEIRRDDQGNMAGIVGTVQDITEAKTLELQLLQSQKMEAIGTLAGGVAHDVNNVLTAILGYASIIQMNLPPDHPMAEKARQIIAAGERAAGFTRSLLAFSRREKGERGPLDLDETVSRLEQLLRQMVRENIEIRFHAAPEAKIVTGDSGQLEQVLINLAVNASDAMPAGGTLVLRTAETQMDEEFIRQHGFGRPGRYAVISVADTGHGMEASVRERIFEPFYTTKEAGKGTGLGLSIAYGIVRQHDGYINCYSEPGQGTVFRVYLPLAQAVPERPKIEERKKMPAGGNETILLVEDDSLVRHFGREILERFGYRVIEAVDGEDAVVKFRETGDQIRLVLMDMVMPKKSGLEAYRAMAALRPEVKTIFMSGYPADLLDHPEIDKPQVDFVTKPMAPPELLGKIREVLAR